MQYSLSCKVGDYIKINTSIAKCGNSGYSPEPHIHIQVQDLGIIGGFTREFCFSELYKKDELIFNTNPKRDEVISSVITDKSISSRLLFILDDSFKYEVFKNSEYINKIEFVIKMNELGEFYFEDKSKNRLFFYNDLKQFYFYNYEGVESHLKFLFKLVPRIPFINKNKIYYKDFLPLYLVKTSLQTMLIELIATVKKDIYKMPVTYLFDSSQISSKYGEVEIDLLNKGFSMIRYNNIELRRVL